MKRPRILIVDDDKNVLMVMARRFSARDCEIFTAGDGDQALESFRANAPDLVLMDIDMPRFDGLLALREILALDPTMPVIIISGAVTEAQAKMALDEGAREFIAKPIDFGLLERAIEAILPNL